MLADMLKIRPSEFSSKGWAFHGEEIKYTSSREMIEQELSSLLQERIFVELVGGSFISSPTVLVGFTQKGVEIDRPTKWNQDLEVVFIKYRLPGLPYYFLRARIERQDASSIYTSYPDILLVLERRQFFRVPVPSGSAVLVQKKRSSQAAAKKKRKPTGYVGRVEDISLGGSCIYFDMRKVHHPPPLRSIVGPVLFRVKLNSEKLWGDIEIGEAEVVRLRETRKHERLEWEVGLCFRVPDSKKKRLHEYIRAREKELIKSGVIS
jgi:c-di-GMP-binding flagellar brake protein YcgR